MRAIILCLLLASCGGGGGSTGASFNPVTDTSAKPSALIYDYRQFAPYLESVTHTANSGPWTATVIDPNTIDVVWGASTEEHRIRDHMGQPWVWLDAYRDNPTGYRYRSETTKAEVNYGQGWVDITPTNGFSLYSPVNVPASGFTLRQWGCIHNDPRFGGECSKRWFHQHKITFVPQVLNSCWTATDRIKDVLRQDEVFWDSVAGWTRGTGNIVNGEPDGNVTMNFYQTIAQGIGYLWTGQGEGISYCLIK